MTVEGMKAKRRGSRNACVHTVVAQREKSAHGKFVRCFKLRYHLTVAPLKGKVRAGEWRKVCTSRAGPTYRQIFTC